MQEMKVKAITAFIILFFFLGQYAASNVGICAVRIKMDREQEHIAFCVGNLNGRPYLTRETFADVFVLDTKEHTVSKIAENRRIGALEWRSVDDGSELWLCVIGETLFWQPKYTLESFAKDQFNLYTAANTTKSPDIVSGLAWNTDGTILAGRHKKMFDPVHFSKYMGAVGVSFDNGKHAKMYLESRVNVNSIVWADTSSFYVPNMEGTAILKFLAGTDGVSVIDSQNYAAKVELLGVGGDRKVVYKIDNDIYVGKQLVYTAENDFYSFRLQYPYLTYIEKANIIRFNVDTKDVSKAKIKTPAVNLGLSVGNETGYLLINNNEICCLSFKSNTLKTVYASK